MASSTAFVWSGSLISSVAFPAEESSVHSLPAAISTQNVTVYARHKRPCPRNGAPYWKRCHCMKYLYLYRDGESRQVSAKTRSWEKAEERAQEIRDSWSPVKGLQRTLEAKVRRSEAPEGPIAEDGALFIKGVQ